MPRPHTYPQSGYEIVTPVPEPSWVFRVDDARSEPWGVLVIDSRSPTFDTKIAQRRFGAYAPVLARLVQGM